MVFHYSSRNTCQIIRKRFDRLGGQRWVLASQCKTGDLELTEVGGMPVPTHEAYRVLLRTDARVPGFVQSLKQREICGFAPRSTSLVYPMTNI
ncbi:hypothetical protein SAMN04488556_3312 [Halostagnicola kamekurae]|uniref:Uncharacterized protein n=1 Tax=Halostagnicola kamekurae TaxID=619731 RepID=A0A1I6TQI5_9EURY|nr:hypothetical protein SAMN04488556_3312 [Halostagnicola kamekurae]